MTNKRDSIMLKKFSFILFIATFLVACSKPIPQDKLNFIGTWQSEDFNTTLIISQDGRLDYKNKEPNRSTSLDAPISEFSGANFSAGIGPFTTEFVVSQAPTQNSDGTWSMIVDNKVLHRQ